MPDTVRLDPQARGRALDAMAAEELDVLVIGGGVVGCGAALDAATRGLRVGLVEARDYAAGTSSRSSKLIHGGLRYLEQLNFGLVREALRERSLILNRLAPHLARAVPFIYPLQHRFWERPYVGSGVLLYDTMGGRHGVPGHRHLTRKQALREFPSLRKDALVGAVKYYDGQVDDARHTMMIARTAAAYGALCATSARVTGFVSEGDRVVGAEVQDLESGRTVTVRARETINAAGVWTDEIQEMVGGHGQFNVRASKGVHVLVPRDRIHAGTGIISRTEKSVLFIIPWDTHWIIGTTDTDWALDLAHPAASRSDIDYLLDHANRLLATPLTHDDVVGVYAGLRPLLAGESDSTSQLSREHAVVSPVPGLTMVAGGKYTTYRVMAQDAVDAAVTGLPGKVAASCTDQVPLVGAEGFAVAWNRRETTAAECGVHVAWVEHLLRRYGTLTDEVLDLVRQDPELGRPIEGAPTYLRAEAVYAAAAEGALHLDDVLTRRTRISIETPDRGEASAPYVAQLVAPVLGWDDATVRSEIEHYLARVEAELQSQKEPDDQTADAARLGAPDVRGLGRSGRPAA
ncbi:glycerol-3-phosphate dehydrogenase/oxidase [Angustibacter sp. Root456]|uniref:glycerol-3-phosphate dehydrogenase/oxidase n=1 Tax=Angustibacter sp. Root456 TaxID=1736539 RepID=UPI0006F206EA|nr:glycerol-3-phosphate dehydrogenase/oxidase [Angustibacter sp. Root456]KQX66685.1 glycerol-3-phosphate dehydrogenase [Angustibacter sp. Root456]